MIVNKISGLNYLRALRAALAVAFSLFAASATADEELPAWIIELPATVEDVFVADTSRSVFLRYANEDGSLKLVSEGYMSIGQKGAGKERAWDRRTPLGVYFVVDELDTTRMPEKYGIAAFPLDYPNEWDRLNQRTGDGIWVHGVQQGPDRRPAYDTDGCIALPNEDLDVLRDRLRPELTPVIVTREMAFRNAQESGALRAALKESLETWIASLSSGDLHGYLSLYAEEFRYRGISAADWAALRFRNFEDRSPIDIEIDEVFLLGDPEVDDLFVSRFRQTIVEGGETRRVVKRLYWKLSPEGDFRIVAEDNG